ncbi:MAG: YfhO family protein [Clostridiales bacterium]|nr:YfhO family protein [Candidatus Scatonaster coprocaballi]
MKPLRKDNRMTFSDNRTKVMLIASFLMPVLILLVIAWRFRIYPFNTDCFMTRTMQDQYLPVIAEFRRKILHGESLFYSWNAGGGSDFWTRIACYTASPFNLLYLLFAPNKLAQATQIIFALKTATAALAFTLMLWKKDNVVSPIGVGLSVAYALSGYVLTYSQEPWMLDVVILLPLLFLSLNQLVQGVHRWSFALVCALLSLTAFRIGLYVLIFILIAFPLLYIEQYQREEGTQPIGGAIKDFLIYLVLGIALSSIVWLPALLTRWNAAIHDTLSFPSDFMAMDIKVWDIFERASFDAPVIFPTTESQLPSVYCGIFTVILSILYGFSSRISISEKICSYCTLVVVYISMSSRLLSFAFHGLHFPVIGAYPQAILIVFMLLYMSGRLISTGELFSDKVHLYSALGMILAFLLIRCKISYDFRYENYTIYVALLFITLYIVLTAKRAKQEGRKQVCVSAALMVVMIVEAGMGFYRPIKEAYFRKTIVTETEESSTSDKMADRLEQAAKVAPVLENRTKKVYKLKDEVLYRVRDEQRVQMMNDVRAKLPLSARVEVSLAGWENNGLYEGVGTLDNLFYLASEDYPETLRALGINNATDGEIDISGGTPVTNNFFNVPLRVTSNQGVLSLEENRVGGSIGYFTDASDINEDIFTSKSAFENQNELSQRFTGMKPFQFLDMEVTKKKNMKEVDGSMQAENPDSSMEVTLQMTESINTPIYIYCHCDAYASIEVLNISESGSKTLIQRVNLPQNSWIEVSSEDLKDGNLGLQLLVSEPKDNIINVTVATMNTQQIELFEQKMNEKAWTLTKFEDGLLQGEINAPTEGNLVLSVPYDEGWEALIDGKKTETLSGFQAFLSVHVPEGHHEVKLIYRPEGLKLGLYGTVGSAVLILALTTSTVWNEKRKKRAHIVQTVSEISEEEKDT